MDLARARLAIETHLERIEQNRPLDQISDTEQRVQAQSVRKWYHLLRRWHHLPAAPYLGQKHAYIKDDPNLAYI